MPATLLVIGASGFAGRHFADAAEAAGFDIVRAARRGGDVRCELLDLGSLERAVSSARPRLVANLAGSASVGASFAAPGEAFTANALGVVNLLEAVRRAAGDAYVLCVSSGEVYGNPAPADLPLVEEAPVAPVSPYGASKAAMEVICAEYARANGLRIGVIRAFNHIGPGQSDAFAASSFARQIAAGERGGPEVVLRTGDLAVERDFTDVRDIAAAYVAVCERELVGTRNACSGRALPVRRIVDELATASKLAIRVETEPSRVRDDEPRRVFGSAARLGAETGWRPQIPLSRTAADLLAWWRRRLDGQ